MNILYCGDKNITDGVLLSALSLADNVKEPLNVYILTASLDYGEKCCVSVPQRFADFLDKKLKSHSPQSTVTLIDITSLFEKELPLANVKTRFTPCCMLRLFADLVPELPDKLLYLDNDVLCRKDPSELYYLDIDDFEFAGVLDRYGKWFFHNGRFKLNYVNSGVLLLNMPLIRQNGLFEKCRIQCAERKMLLPDQSALNKLSGSKKLLPRKFNEQKRLKDDTTLQHFTTYFRFLPYFRSVTVKPWDIERLHSVLKNYEYDTLLEKYLVCKNEYEKEILQK